MALKKLMKIWVWWLVYSILSWVKRVLAPLYFSGFGQSIALSPTNWWQVGFLPGWVALSLPFWSLLYQRNSHNPYGRNGASLLTPVTPKSLKIP